MGFRDGIKELFSSKDDMDYPDNYGYDGYGRSSSMPVMEMRVPLCCDNCERKVRDALEEMHGVKDVYTNRDSNRVTVTGYVDPMKALRRVRKLKPKSELHGDNTYINRTSHAIERIDSPQYRPRTEYISSSLVHNSGYDRDYDRVRPSMVRLDSYGRPRGAMNRLNSFGRVERYDDRRSERLVPLDLQRDYYDIRRMPSLGRHRYHDAEYIAMGDDFRPAMAETHYVPALGSRYERGQPMYRSQVSFSKLPVQNPYYMKSVDHEYNY